MDQRLEIWNVLHDGEITAAARIESNLTLFVNIPYLRRRIKPLGDSFVLKLNGVTELVVRDFSGDEESLEEQLDAGRLEILHTESQSMPAVIHTSFGQLTLSFERLELALDTGQPISFEAIDQAASDYWREWEQNAAKHRGTSA